jgi:hypothetical protein
MRSSNIFTRIYELICHVNGATGVVEKIIYDTDNDGCHFAICCYVHINGCGLQAPGLDKDIVPVTNHFIYCGPDGAEYNISRTQLPLIPAFAYTDYKSQGRDLTHAIADLSSCGSIQSMYEGLNPLRVWVFYWCFNIVSFKYFGTVITRRISCRIS